MNLLISGLAARVTSCYTPRPMVEQQLLDRIKFILDEQQAEDILCLDVRELTSVTDYMLICTGRSTRHVAAVAENLVDILKVDGHRPIAINGQTASEWVLVDYGDVIVHVMQGNTRQYYNLEGLWALPDENPAD